MRLLSLWPFGLAVAGLQLIKPVRHDPIKPVASHARKARGSIAGLNRWTGAPHQHARERARRAKRGGAE